MRRTLPLLALTLALWACHQRRPTPAQQAAADAREIAQVEAAQKNYGPTQPLSPQPITTNDVEHNNLYGAGCAFVPQGWGDPALVARSKRALVKLDGHFTTFASDPGSTALPLGAWTHYVGKARSLRIDKQASEGVRTGEDKLRWAGTATITDEHDRIVYRSAGEIECGA